MKLLKKIIYFILEKIIRNLPLRNIIVFECESDMDDNPRAIYEYMLNEKKYRKYRFVWIVKNLEYCQKHYNNERTVFISRFDDTRKNKFLFEYYLSVARYFLFSHPYWFKKRHSAQIVIHTTHGTPFKGCDKNGYVPVDTYDFVLCASEYTKNWFLKILNCPSEKAFICPHPRIDLFNGNKREEAFAKLFECSPTDKFIICMPTFKQSCHREDCSGIDEYSLSVVENESEFKSLNDFLKANNIHLIVKLHPLQVTDNLKFNNTTNIHYIQNKELFEKKIQLYNLIGCCDAMITDFSSVMFDYFVLNRPIAFFTNFFDQYNRGYIMDNPKDYLCGEKINNYNDLMSFLTNFHNNNDVFYEQRNHINSLVNNPLPNNCCKQFVDRMFRL